MENTKDTYANFIKNFDSYPEHVVEYIQNFNETKFVDSLDRGSKKVFRWAIIPSSILFVAWVLSQLI